MPPPASQDVNVNGLWSRPLPPWLHGIRPNSVVQMTIVSSSRPRAFRSLIRAAAGWSMLAAHVAVVAGEVLVRVPVAAREAVVGAAPDLHEPHAALQQPPGDQAVAAEVLGDRLVQAVERLRRRRSRPTRSSTSGALSCKPGGQLVGGDARVEPRVALARLAACSRLSCFSRARPSRSLSRRDAVRPRAGRGRRSGSSAPARTIVPWCAAGRKPAPQLAGPLGAKPRESGRTTNVGRLSFRLPSP